MTKTRSPTFSVGSGGLHGGHLVVLWNEDGHGYLASVHGERLSRRALISIALTMARSTSLSRTL